MPWIALLLLAAPPRFAPAVTPETPLEEARRLLDEELDFTGASVRLEALLARRTSSRTTRIAALDLLAICQVALGRPDEAERTYLELLELAPDFDVVATRGPKVRGPFLAARRAFERRRPELYPPSVAQVGDQIWLIGHIRDPEGLLGEILLHARFDDGSPTTTAMQRRDGTYEMALALPRTARRFAWSIEARARADWRIAVTEKRALSILPPAPPAPFVEPPATAWYERWWVWTIVGGVAVAGASGAAVVAFEGERDDGLLGRIKVR